MWALDPWKAWKDKQGANLPVSQEGTPKCYRSESVHVDDVQEHVIQEFLRDSFSELMQQQLTHGKIVLIEVIVVSHKLFCLKMAKVLLHSWYDWINFLIYKDLK
jgi:hypothetical protein